MLAQRLPGLLPPMSEAEALEVAAVRSVAGLPLKPAQWRVRPFRSPHHTASAVALVGGGPGPRPGEISLAHHGVLFLDELPEFDRRVLEVLREPLESGVRHDLARRTAGGVSGDVSVDRRDESLSVRLSRRRARPLPLHRRASAALSQPTVRTAARSARPARRSAARADGSCWRSDREQPRRVRSWQRACCAHASGRSRVKARSTHGSTTRQSSASARRRARRSRC